MSRGAKISPVIKVKDKIYHKSIFKFPRIEDDDICRLCFALCTSKSSCSNRYMQVQGKYIDFNPEKGEISYDPEKVDVAPICDKCFVGIEAVCNKNGIITILGCKFHVDCAYRMND